MGESVTPEVVTLFCDRCRRTLKSRGDFDARLEFMDRDWGGGIVYSHKYEICMVCRMSLAEWWEKRDVKLDIIFDGPPSHESGRFIEVNDSATGASIRWGRWRDNEDGTWSLLGPAFLTEVNA